MTDPEPDLGPLEDQRDFLLRSLEDLEREHEAGDVDDADYAALKDDYTVRAARVLRALEAGRTATPVGKGGVPQRVVLGVAGVVLLAVLSGVLVAQAAGRREAGETVSGDVRLSTTEKLNRAQQRMAEQDLDGAVELFDEVLESDPTNVEAMTYRGWTLFLQGDPADALPALVDAATEDPSYPDAHAFLAVVFFRLGLLEQADLALDRLETLQPRAEIRELTEGLRAQVDAALATTTTTAAPPAIGEG